MANQAVNEGLNGILADDFEACLKLRGRANLTMGFFWMNPEEFLSADSKNKSYLEGRGVIYPKKEYTLEAYKNWITKVRGFTNDNFPQFSHEAHLESTDKNSEPPSDPKESFESFTQQIEPSHVLAALEDIDREGIPKRAQSSTYDLIHDEKRYPPKLVLSLAAKHANGQELARDLFHGGEQSKCFALLRKLGFQIEKKTFVGENGLASPFDKIFENREEAEKVFDLFRGILQSIGIGKGHPHPALSLTAPIGKRQLSLSYGNYQMAGYMHTPWKGFEPHKLALTIMMKLMLGREPNDEDKNGFAETPHGERFSMYGVTLDETLDESSNLWQKYIEGSKLIRDHFNNWSGSPYARSHRPELVEMCFDNEIRDKYLTEGLPEKAPSRVKNIASPFNKIFENREQAEQTFTLYGKILEKLGVDENDSSKALALTIPKNTKQLNLSFGRILIAGFNARGWKSHEKANLVLVVLMRLALGREPREDETSFKDQPGGERYAHYRTTLDEVLNEDSEMWQNFDEGIESLRDFYKDWSGSVYREKAHRNELVQMCFDEAIRDKYLSEGLPGEKTKQETEESIITIEESPESWPGVPPWEREVELPGIFMDDDDFDHILALIQRKKNIILRGAPGTGKTFIADQLGWAILRSKDPDRVRLVQFHQSYSYEDFVMGYRPTGDGGFELRTGAFHDLCTAARKDRDTQYFLVIDEINRGNLSKIFGELMMLIETDKRKERHAMRLAYDDDDAPLFHVPPNIHIIGTMNTADRSLALVDYALRRRFAFITMQPGYGHKKFKKWLKRAGISKQWISIIVDRMNSLNETISKDTSNLGPGYCIGHSFFTPSEGTTIEDVPGWYRDCITYEIQPLLEEYWIDGDGTAKLQIDKLLNDLPSS